MTKHTRRRPSVLLRALRPSDNNDDRSKPAHRCVLLPSAAMVIERLESRMLLSVSFSAPIPSPAGPSPSAVAVADFNKDGKLDAVVTNPMDEELSELEGEYWADRYASVLLGNGSGGFAAPVRLTVDYDPLSVAVGDLNNDGNQDVVTANDIGSSISPFVLGDVSVLLGDGTGGFAPAVHLAVGNGEPLPMSVAIGDFNGDGRQDLATANAGTDNVGVLLGNGVGGFAPAVSFPVSDWPASVVVGDFNGDGRQDLAVSSSQSSNVGVLLGNGAGGFASVVNLPGGGPSLAVGDFNRDGRTDLAASSSGNVSLLLGNGNGGFAAPLNFPVGAIAYSLAVGDFGADGILDVAVARADGLVSVLEGSGAGGFTAPVSYPTDGNHNYRVAVGDFNSDGKPDLVTTNSGSDAVNVLLNTNGASAPSTLAINNVSVTEGNSGSKSATFTVTRSGSTSGSASVSWSTANGTAVAPGDYTAVGATVLQFSAGQTSKQVSVLVNGDTTVESNETFNVNLSNATGATIADAQGVGTITNDDTSSQATTQVSLAGAFNQIGIYNNGATFPSSGGLDGYGHALSKTLLGNSTTWNGNNFTIGPAGANDVVRGGSGVVVNLPAVQSQSLQFLGTATNGNQANQSFVVRYTDGTTSTFTRGISDWRTPQNYSGESTAVTMAYRNTSSGGQDNRTFHLYGYTLALNAAKTVQSITLPNNTNVKLLAITLVGTTGSVIPVTPAAPTNLAAQATSSSRINLSWNASSGATSYNIYRSTTSNGQGTTPYRTGITGTTFSDTALTPSTTYFYKVAAVNTAGTSPQSSQASATTLAPSTSTTTRVSLAGAFNRAGIYANGATFSGSGGLDQYGHALSANLLGSSLSWGGTTFTIGPAGTNNIVHGGSGVTVNLPSGKYASLRLVATAVNGNQANQSFVVRYTDGTTSTFTRGISDWRTPQNYSGESTAVTMAYRNTSSGGQDNRTFHLYGYTLALNAAKTVQSITLPNNVNVEVVAMNLVAT